MNIKTITPVEFDRDGYRRRWIADEIMVLAYLEGGTKDGIDIIAKKDDYYQIWCWDSGDYSYKMRPYEHSLIIIENPDYDELRRQLSKLVLNIPDCDVIYELAQNGWRPDKL